MTIKQSPADDRSESACPRGNKNCEGVDADADRPELCVPCWKEWAAYDPDDYLKANTPETADSPSLSDDDGDIEEDIEAEAEALVEEMRKGVDGDETAHGVPTCGVTGCTNPAPNDAQEARSGLCEDHKDDAGSLGDFGGAL